MDQLAHELGMDALELRRKNFIPPFATGHETPIGVVYDSGNYEAALDKLLEHIDPAQVHREAEALREQGIYRGIGFSTYTEICGNAPSRAVGPGGFGLQGGGWESATDPRPRHRVGNAVHGHIASRPRSRDGVRADRGGPARHRSAAGRGDPRRHRHRPVRARHVWLALARRRRRGGRAGGGQGREQGQGDRRPPARGGARGHRAAATASSRCAVRPTRG